MIRPGVRHLLPIFLALAALQAFGAPVYPSEQWERLPDDDRHWSRERLKAADDFARTLKTDAYLVVHQGRIVHEYGATSRAMHVYSVRKSILSVLYGIHRDRFSIDLGKTLGELRIDDRQGLTEMESRATVRQLLQARSGVYHPAAYENDVMASRRPPRGRYAPGEYWYYNNWDFNALGTIFATMTGKSVFEALRDDLAQPLQFEDFSPLLHTKWVYDPASQHPAYTMQLSARDLARVGLLMARDGQWRGKQVVPQDWVRESTTSYSKAGPTTGYGYMWWIATRKGGWAASFPGPVYWAHGNAGQVVLVDPTRDFVFVHRVNPEGGRHRRVANSDIGKLLKLVNSAYSEETP